MSEGTGVGKYEGAWEDCRVGWVDVDGALDRQCDGAGVGMSEGVGVGKSEGAWEGIGVGKSEGMGEGGGVGAWLGWRLGAKVGLREGLYVLVGEGVSVGTLDGKSRTSPATENTVPTGEMQSTGSTESSSVVCMHAESKIGGFTPLGFPDLYPDSMRLQVASPAAKSVAKSRFIGNSLSSWDATPYINLFIALQSRNTCNLSSTTAQVLGSALGPSSCAE
jgi:hypothetical protein